MITVHKRTRRAFTLIEILVVLGVIGLSLPAFFAIVFSLFRQQAKMLALQEVKRQGDSMMVIMENIIKNDAEGVYRQKTMATPECLLSQSVYPAMGNSDGTDFYFRDKLGYAFSFQRRLVAGNYYLASDSSHLASMLYLNNKRVTLDSFAISCRRNSSETPPMIMIGYTVSYGDIVSMPFQTKIKMRSY